jgi:putative membrane-bound dehydrogenase-like protein
MKPFSITQFAISLAVFLYLGAHAIAEEKRPKKPAPGEKTVLERVPLKSPEEALATFEVADGYRMEQVAAEPLLADPVAMAFDEHGRLYVVEMIDYSEREKEWLGQIRLLTDKDGDGRYETSQVFVEELSWPTAVICYDGGIFVGNAPHILYFKDMDGDGAADQQRLVYSGFGRGNMQGLLNSFQWGLDNRIYGSGSTAGGRIKTHGVKGKPLDLSGHDFVFDPRTLKIEATTGGGQHGMTFNRWGDRFVCHNSDHLQAIVFEERYVARNPYQSVLAARRSIAEDGPQAPVFRASPVEAWRVARTQLRLAGKASGPIEGGGTPAGYFTSGTGITAYEGGLWNTGNDDVMLIADVGSNLVHRKRLVPDGVTYRGQRIDKNSEFVRSTDIWFRPVQMAIGPEGALYIADMYREVIEHPASLPPEIKKQLDLNSGNDRGRLYRVVPADYEHVRPAVLADMTTDLLVAELAGANQWRRTTASRLLWERQDPKTAALLRAQLAASNRPEGRIAILYSLAGTGNLTPEDVMIGLGDSHAQVRRHALRLAEPLLSSANQLLEKVLTLASDPEPKVRFQLLLTLGETDDARATEVIGRLMLRDGESSDMVHAALTSIRMRAGSVLQQLLRDETWLASSHAQSVITAIVGQIVRQRRDGDLEVLLAALKAPQAAGHPDRVELLLRALSKVPDRALASAASPQVAELQRIKKSAAAKLVRAARELLEQNSGPAEARVAAIQNLGFDTFKNQREVLEELLSPQQPAAIHKAVLETCAGFEAPAVAQMVLAQWEQFAPAERLQATELLLRRAKWALPLLQFMKDNKIALTTLDPGHVARLENYPSAEVSKLARSLRGKQVAQDRKKVFDDYRDAALAAGDAAKGKSVFEKNCSSCHQLGGIGQEIGPNLASMVSRGAESVLFNVIVPNGEVDPRYLEYVLVTADGDVLTGVIAGETSTAVTLRNAENKLTTVLRVDIESLQNTGRSLMPEGLEKLIDKPAMADLLAYLQQAASDGAHK